MQSHFFVVSPNKIFFFAGKNYICAHYNKTNTFPLSLKFLNFVPLSLL